MMVFFVYIMSNPISSNMGIEQLKSLLDVNPEKMVFKTECCFNNHLIQNVF